MIKRIKSYAMITLGCALSGFAIACFLLPNEMAAGGLTGVATIINHLFKLPVGTVALVLNIPLLWLGVRVEGSHFGIRTCVASFLFSLFIDLFAFVPVITNDFILASLYGGAILGVGMGIVFCADATTGGIDIVAKLMVNKLPWVSIGQAMMTLDIIIILAASVIFKSLYTGLYSIIALYLSTIVIDDIVEGVNFAKTVMIITNKYEDMAQKIMTSLERGITGLYGKGMYTGKDKVVLLCTVKRKQIPTLRQIVAQTDKDAFVITSDSREVIGEGFERDNG